MKTILFVCTGNTCRSPMAEALARRALADKPGWRIVSAGIGAINGQAPSAHGVTAMKEVGIDISGHRSQMLSGKLVREADHIFGLTFGHVEGVGFLYPEAAEKTFVLREFDDRLEEHDKDMDETK